MSKGSRNKGDLARRSPTQSLDHTANGRPNWEPVPLSPVRNPLMRTVLGDTAQRRSPSLPVKPAARRSPTVAVRASGRSSQRQIKSPFLNATLLTPQLSQRAMLCARRTIRREVLFAVKRTSKGSSGSRRPRSKVGC